MWWPEPQYYIRVRMRWCCLTSSYLCEWILPCRRLRRRWWYRGGSWRIIAEGESTVECIGTIASIEIADFQKVISTSIMSGEIRIWRPCINASITCGSLKDKTPVSPLFRALDCMIKAIWPDPKSAYWLYCFHLCLWVTRWKPVPEFLATTLSCMAVRPVPPN